MQMWGENMWDVCSEVAHYHVVLFDVHLVMDDFYITDCTAETPEVIWLDDKIHLELGHQLLHLYLRDYATPYQGCQQLGKKKSQTKSYFQVKI